ncbi:MAG: glycosyltransferase family 39 protein [Minisyncoccia bacterium]
MTKAILDGSIPYKDFFTADPPFFIYTITLFKTFIGSNIILFIVFPVLLDSLSAIIIYLIIKEKEFKFAFLGPILYLFSFTVLSTSDYVTGAELMISLMLLALYTEVSKKHFWSGVFWALACLCKLYAAPALIGVLVYKMYKKEFVELKQIIIGGLIATLIVLLPFIIMAPKELFYDLIIHQFRRPIGINKWGVLEFFISLEWFILLVGIIGAFISKNKIWVVSLLSSIVFFLVYRDLYYLYLHLLIPFIILLTVELVDFLDSKAQEFSLAFIIFFIFISIFPVSTYSNTIKNQGVFVNPEEIVEALKTAPDSFPVYGVQEVAPLVALLANKNIAQNIIDTNTQNFASGTHNRDKISKEVVKDGVYLIARVGEYPEQNIHDTGFENYFSEKIFKDTCTKYKSFKRTNTVDELNEVAIYRCKL